MAHALLRVVNIVRIINLGNRSLESSPQLQSIALIRSSYGRNNFWKSLGSRVTSIPIRGAVLALSCTFVTEKIWKILPNIIIKRSRISICKHLSKRVGRCLKKSVMIQCNSRILTRIILQTKKFKTSTISHTVKCLMHEWMGYQITSMKFVVIIIRPEKR